MTREQVADKMLEAAKLYNEAVKPQIELEKTRSTAAR